MAAPDPYPLLSAIDSPTDLRRLQPAQLAPLARELREFLIQTVSQMGLMAEKVADGVRFTSGAEVTLETIIDLTESSSHLAAQIAQATQEQMRGSRGAAQAIETVATMVQQAGPQPPERPDLIGEFFLEVREDFEVLVFDYTYVTGSGRNSSTSPWASGSSVTSSRPPSRRTCTWWVGEYGVP